MPKKAAKSKRQKKPGANTEIHVGGAYINGSVNTGGGDFAGRDLYKTSGLSSGDVAQLFERFYAVVEARSDPEPSQKADLKSELEEVEEEVAKGDEADETFLSDRLRNIGRMAPDILDVVLATLVHPASGVALVVRKLAEKMKKEAEAKS